MRRKLMLLIALWIGLMVLVPGRAHAAHDFGDHRSETLISKAWVALGAGDLEAVLAYTNKCIELYAGQAQKMQNSLTEYVTGSNDKIFANWALNDVATGLFIQGEAYRKANQQDKAKEAFQRLVNEFSYGQTWDSKGWFWKPAEAAKEKIAMIDSASTLDFGDYTSSFLTTQAWKALIAEKLDDVTTYTNKVVELYAKQAKQMQSSLTEYPWESKEKIFSYWALNDVGTSLFIRGEALRKAGQSKMAKENYQKLVDEYYYAQTWDPKGWFWKPAEAAQQALDELGEI